MKKMTDKKKLELVGALYAGDTFAEVAERFGISKVYANWIFADITGQAFTN